MQPATCRKRIVSQFCTRIHFFPLLLYREAGAGIVRLREAGKNNMSITRNSLRFCGGIALAAALQLAANSHSFAGETGSPAIPAMNLEAALNMFAQQTGFQVVYVSKVTDGVTTQGATAGLPPQVALAQLLKGTGLHYRLVNARTVTISGDAAAPADNETPPAPPAQESPQHPNRAVVETAAFEEIIVTARKREESIMKTPVVMQAIGAIQIKDLHITDIASVQAAIPGLLISPAFASSGATVYLRGLGNGSSANYVDQSVSLNLDGVGVSSGTFYRGGLFDVAQIEVLKGPQALFYGKGTSAGVIAIHSAVPTKEWESQVRVGYEFNADEMDLDGYISGPITDALGMRVAGYHNTTKGWWVDPNPAGPGRMPDGTDDGGRLMISYNNPAVGLRIKLKGEINNSTSNMPSGYSQHSICSGGVSSVPYYNQFADVCNLRSVDGNPNPKRYAPGPYTPFDPTAFANTWPSPIFKDGKPYASTKTSLAALNIDYDLTPELTFTSVTGYSHLDAGETIATFNPTTFYGVGARALHRNYTEEIRLASNFKDSWINFMIGGLYDTNQRKDTLPLILPDLGIYSIDTGVMNEKTKSVFGQILLTPIDKFELSAGVRYTSVDKQLVSFISENNYSFAYGVNTSGLQQINSIPEANRNFKESATTPEVTLTYRPTDDVTAFVSYKKGYKGPGFNVSLTDVIVGPQTAAPVRGERVEGAEGGVKSSLLDRHLALQLTGYRYDYTGLQVAIPVGLIVVVHPDANARVQGFELGADYSPAGLSGLTLHASVNYNDAHYTKWTNAPCWGGQLPSQGCTVDPVTATRTQDITGRRLAYAAKWNSMMGVDYTTDITDNYSLAMNVSGRFSSNYMGTYEQNPLSLQPGYVALDAAIHLTKSHESWDLALLGRNLTDRLWIVAGYDRGIAGAPNGVPAAIAIQLPRPREVMLQLTVHPAKIM